MKYQLTEILDIDELSRLCQSFTDINGISTAILDNDSNVLIGTGWQPVCTQFHRVNSQAKKLCYESDTVLASQIKHGQKFNIYKCKNGLVDVAMPIMVGDEQVGMLFIGQFFDEKPDLAFFKKQADKYGFDKSTYMAAIATVPIIGEEQVRANITFLVQLTEMIGSLGLNKLHELEGKQKVEEEKLDLEKNNEKLSLSYQKAYHDLVQEKEQAQKRDYTYRMLFQNLKSGYALHEIILDENGLPCDYRFLEANPAFEELTGLRADDIIGKTVLTLMPDTERSWIDTYGQVAMTGKVVNLENYSQVLNRYYQVTAYSPEEGKFATVFSDITQRKQVEEMRNKFVMLVNSSSEFIGMCDLDLNPIYVNLAGIRMVGLPDQEAACKVKVQEYFFPEDQQFIAEEFFPRVLREGEGSVEIRLRNFQTGDPIWMYYYLFSVKDDSGKSVGWATVSRDITERRQAEEALRRSEEDLKESQRIAHVGSWRLDIASNQVVWSEELYRMYGLDPASPPPPYPEHKKLFTEESWGKLSVALDNTAKTQIPYELELETVRNDGCKGWMWVYGKAVTDDKGAVVGLFGAAQDITDRKNYEEKIHRLNTELEQRVQERTEELRSKNGTLEHTIARLQETQSQLILFEKLTVLRHLVSGIAHEINNPLGAIDSSREMLNISINKLVQNVSLIAQWLNGPDGGLISELIQMAEHSSDIEAGMSSREKRDIRSGVIDLLNSNGIADAHEVGLLMMDLNVYDKVERFIPLLRHSDIVEKLHIVRYIMDCYVACNNIKTAVSKSSKIVNALGGYVRKGADWQNKNLADINDGLETVLLLFQNAFKYFVNLELNLAENLPEIMCFPDQLNQVWTNIIQNALQAMNNNGKLAIESRSEGDGVLVRVTDIGCGMSPEVKARIFEPLFTTKPAGEGLGLGMDIVHMIIVERHHGRIDIESEQGKGTTVSVWLPIGDSQ